MTTSERIAMFEYEHPHNGAKVERYKKYLTSISPDGNEITILTHPFWITFNYDPSDWCGEWEFTK